jgi:hypothetical protein
MPETWVNIYLWALIGLSFVGIVLLVFCPLSRIFGKPKSSDDRLSALRRKSLIRECIHLAVGVMALALFKLGILGGWAVAGFVTGLLIGVEYVLPFLIKPSIRAAG